MIFETLTSDAIPGGLNKAFGYDVLGNLTLKSDIGTYAYGSTGTGTGIGPHQAVVINNSGLRYDADGNVVTQGGRSFTWTSFDAVNQVNGGAVGFSYDPEHNRLTQAEPALSKSTLYLRDPTTGAYAELFTGNATQLWRDYVFAGATPIGMLQSSATGSSSPTMLYYHTDALGSVIAISDDTGRSQEVDSYDAWGKQRFADGTDDPNDTIVSLTPRGFTDQEELTDLHIIHMNGRIYDPLIGRFLSADPTVEAPYDGQNWNRYSYVGNNPLRFTDPSGYCFLGCFWESGPFKFFAPVLIAATQPWLAGVFESSLGFSAGLAGFTSSAVTGAAAGGAQSGNIQGVLLSAAQAAAFFEVGDLKTGSFDLGSDVRDFARSTEGSAILHGVVGGLTSIPTGNFQSGFLAAGFSDLAGPYLETGDKTLNTAVHAISGGVASTLGGGKFANGAVTGAFGYLYNYLAHGQDLTPKEGQNVADAAATALKTPYAPLGSIYAGANAQLGPNGSADCSGSVCAIYDLAGDPYRYTDTRSFANAAAQEGFPFRGLNAGELPQVGDVVLYLGHLSIYAGDDQVYSARKPGFDFGKFPLDGYFGKPTGFFRYQVPKTGG